MTEMTSVLCSYAEEYGEDRPEVSPAASGSQGRSQGGTTPATGSSAEASAPGEGLSASALLGGLLSGCFQFLPQGVSLSLLQNLQKEQRSSSALGDIEPVAYDHPVMVFLVESQLSQYAGVLVRNGFDDMETLLCIDDEDMKELGIPRGHMVRLKKRLRETSTAKAPATIIRIASVGKPPGAVSARCQQPTESMMSAVEKSWELVQTYGTEAVAETLYRTLFELAPETTSLFPPEVRHKYAEWNVAGGTDESNVYDSPALRSLFGKVMSAVGTAVAGLHDLNQLVPRLTQLGMRHAGYGVKEQHFNILGKALIRTLQKTLGHECTPEVEFAWTMVYNFIAAVMSSGWREVKDVQRSASAAVRAQSCKSLKSTGKPTALGPLALGSAVEGAAAAGSPELSARSHFSARSSQSKAAGSIGDTTEQSEESREIHGGSEVYRIERHLQKAIFGDVYEAVGMTSGRSFAIKVLDRDVVQRFASVQQMDHQFCESPLCEVKYLEVMKGLDHVVQMEEHFGDEFYHFVVSELATGGDLLEALRLRPGGFKERQAQLLIREAARGLMSLHQRGLAMQDVSLENMLLYVLDDGTWQVRICDPGQAAEFTVDPHTKQEMPVPFRGFVGKDFRPPELYAKREYLATKVDSWCLGWSAFYLLVARPMFLSADPLTNDPNWALFNRRAFSKLFQEKGWRATLSPSAKDFILRLMHINPRQRMSIKEALKHPWLADERIWRGCVPEPSRPLLEGPQPSMGFQGRSRSAVVSSSSPPAGAGDQPGTDSSGMTIRVGCTTEFQIPSLSLQASHGAPAPGWTFQQPEDTNGAMDWPSSVPLESKEDSVRGWHPPELKHERKAQAGAAMGNFGFPQVVAGKLPQSPAGAVKVPMSPAGKAPRSPAGGKAPAASEDEELLRKMAGPTLLRAAPTEIGGKEPKAQALHGFAPALH